MSSTIIVMTFDDEKNASKALTVLDSLRGDKVFELSDAVVVTKHMDKSVSVKESKEFTTKKGAISGGLAGLVVGLVVGGPIGVALLGAGAGALAGKVIDLGVPDEEIEAVSASLDRASSALLLELKAGDPNMLVKALEQSGGQLYELSISKEVKNNLEELGNESNPNK